MFSKRKEKPQDDIFELDGQEVSEDILDQFEQPTDKELDDIDLALESATLRVEPNVNAAETASEEWDAISVTDEKEELSADSINTDDNQNIPPIVEDLDSEISEDNHNDETVQTDKPVAQKNGISKGVFFSTILFMLVLSGASLFYIFASLQDTVAITERLDTTISQLASSETEIRLNTDNLKQVLTQNQQQMQSQINSINETTASLVKDTTRITGDVQNIQSKLQSNELQLDEALVSLQTLNGEIQHIENHLTNAISGIKKDVNARSLSAPPEINTENALEGATLESVDVWNYASYANLRTPEGAWISLKETERYKGWIIKHINDDSVVVTRNGQDKTLFING